MHFLFYNATRIFVFAPFIEPRPVTGLKSTMDELSARHTDILEILGRRGYASIDELSATFDVTPQTLRRDLQELADRGLLRRHHGGASAHSSTSNTDYASRHVENAAEKARLATVAATLIPTGASVFLTPGTTIEAAAKAIVEHGARRLRVVTNSTAAATILERAPEVSIELTGGRWLGGNRALGGNAAVEAVERYRCDFFLTSIGAVDETGCLLEYRDEEVVVARAMLRNSRCAILLADHSKFERVASCKLGHITQFSTLVTDLEPAAALADQLDKANCEVVVV